MREGGTVFLIDDDDSVRRALVRLIRSAGFDVKAYASAATFLACVPPDNPCCLVLDVRIPEVGGLELQERLHRWGWEIPIVFITGYSDTSTRARAMKAGAIDFLQKPFDGPELLDSVHRAIAHDRRMRAERAAGEATEPGLGS